MTRNLRARADAPENGRPPRRHAFRSDEPSDRAASQRPPWDTPAADEIDAPVTQPPAAGGEPSLLVCEQCHHEVPALDFCVRCGDPLLVERQRASRSRSPAVAASSRPRQRSRPSACTSRRCSRSCPTATWGRSNWCSAIGLGAIVGLAIVGVYPVAFAAALVLVPLMMVLYMWDVDVYEDEPLRVIGYTAGWGIVTGLIAGLLIRAFVPLDIGAFGSITTETLVVRGVVIPLLGGVVMLAGPLVLLPYRKFNDVLDGATFGATAAVTFVAAQSFAQAVDLFAGGIRPAGDPLPWVVRLVALGIANPVIAAGAIGSAAGALWLRHRAPIADRHRLGLSAGRSSRSSAPRCSSSLPRSASSCCRSSPPSPGSRSSRRSR